MFEREVTAPGRRDRSVFCKVTSPKTSKIELHHFKFTRATKALWIFSLERAGKLTERALTKSKMKSYTIFANFEVKWLLCDQLQCGKHPLHMMNNHQSSKNNEDYQPTK